MYRTRDGFIRDWLNNINSKYNDKVLELLSDIPAESIYKMKKKFKSDFFQLKD
jgi:hypothetical protein